MWKYWDGGTYFVRLYAMEIEPTTLNSMTSTHSLNLAEITVRIACQTLIHFTTRFPRGEDVMSSGGNKNQEDLRSRTHKSPASLMHQWSYMRII